MSVCVCVRVRAHKCESLAWRFQSWLSESADVQSKPKAWFYSSNIWKSESSWLQVLSAKSGPVVELPAKRARSESPETEAP